MNEEARETAATATDDRASQVISHPCPLSMSEHIWPSAVCLSGIVFGSTKTPSAAATWTPIAMLETRTTWIEPTKWRASPASHTAATGMPMTTSQNTSPPGYEGRTRSLRPELRRPFPFWDDGDVTALIIDTPHGPAQAHIDDVKRPRGVLVLGHGAGGGVAAKDVLAARAVALSVDVSV